MHGVYARGGSAPPPLLTAAARFTGPDYGCTSAGGIAACDTGAKKAREILLRMDLTGFCACEVACHRTFQPLPASEELTYLFGCTAPGYKRGKRPHVKGGAYDPERVQLCSQGMLLREHGYRCDEDVLYFVAGRERVVSIGLTA